MARSTRLLSTLCLLALLALALAPAARADVQAFLVKDINTQPVEDRMSNPSSLVAVGDITYFVADTQRAGRQLWRSDGTPAGTWQVVKIGQYNAFDPYSPFARLINVNGTLFFVANDGEHGPELWRSDGSAAGTRLVPGPGYGIYGDLTGVGATLFFTFQNSLWKSDGSAAGTVLVKNLAAGHLTDVGGRLFFVSYTGTSAELWQSDGTPAGTTRVRAFPSAAAIQTIGNLTNVGGRLFFSVDDGRGGGAELWRSDSTLAGTVRVKDINSGAGSAFSSNVAASFTAVGGTLFFAADDGRAGVELWRSDGTSAGTTLVRDIEPGALGAYPRGLTNVGGTLFFAAQDDSGLSRLWKSDGTAAGTALVKDVYLSLDSHGSVELAGAGGMLYFSGNDVKNGFELWKSDGSEAGTVLVKDIAPRSRSSAPHELTGANGRLFFAACCDATELQQLWVSDGTAAGTLSLEHVDRSTAASYPAWQTNLNGTLFFTANDGLNGQQLWKSDGTAAGTLPALLLGDCFQPSWLTSWNGALYFACGSALIKSDGTPTGTLTLTDTTRFGNGVGISSLGILSDTLFFVADAGDGAPGVWRSDGTAAGTRPVSEINGEIVGPVGELAAARGKLFLTAGYLWGAYTLWTSDGTAAGTVPIRNFSAPPGRFPPPGIHSLATVGDTLYFSAYDEIGGFELWNSDGTVARTRRVKDINPGAKGSEPADLVSLGGKLYFSADDGASGRELWQSDGSDAGTTRVVDLLPGAGGANPNGLASLNGKLFFAANDGAHGQELWQSDGSAAGTRLVVDIAPGSAGSWPSGFALAGGYLFFSADDGAHGQELWAISSGVDTRLTAPPRVGAAPGGAAGIAIQYADLGLTSASALTLTATLDPALAYIGDTSGVTPTLGGSTIAWRLPPASGVAGGFTLRVRAPMAEIGATYPLTLTLAAAGETHPADNSVRLEVMVAHQVYMPMIVR